MNTVKNDGMHKIRIGLLWETETDTPEHAEAIASALLAVATLDDVRIEVADKDGNFTRLTKWYWAGDVKRRVVRDSLDHIRDWLERALERVKKQQVEKQEVEKQKTGELRTKD